MRSTAPMKVAKIGYIIISALLCVFGILLIVLPDFSAAVLNVICACILIFFGLVKLVGYFSRDLYRLAFQYDLPFGILLILIGIIMITNPGSLMTFMSITLGVYILTDGLFKIQISLESKKFGIKKWWLIFAFAVLCTLGGLLLMFRPGEGTRVLMVLLGITLLLEGILNFSTVITAVKIVKNQRPDVIEIDNFEERKD